MIPCPGGCGVLVPKSVVDDVMSRRFKSRFTPEQEDAQRKLDDIDSELNDLYRQVREKEAERAKYNRIVHPEDYE